MAEKQETADDIIAEMLGARTEFPFVYLMGEPDTPEIVDVKTKKIIEPRKINIRHVTVKELANRLEAAHKRERGNFAALREALKAIGGLCDRLIPTWDGAIGRIKDIAEAALATPARNCDRFATETDAQIAFLNEAWLIGISNLERDPFDGWTNEMKSAYSKWLFAPATKKEGGAK